MATSLSQGLGEQVTCPICLEHYSDPRLLPCLHTYCRQCLQDLLSTGRRRLSVICPQCREEVQIISGDVNKLKVNFWINNLLSLLAIHSPTEVNNGGAEFTACENCDSKKAAKGRCVNCCVFLCNVCFTAHQRLLALKDHQLMTLDELKDKGIPVIEKQLFCAKHKGEVMKLYCKTCQELLCRDCTIIDHRDHKFSFIEDAAEEHKEKLKLEITRASKTTKNVVEVLKSVQDMKENVKKASKAIEKNVDDFIDKQSKALEEKRITLKEETRSIAAKKMKELATQEDGLTMHLTGLKSAMEFTEKLLNNGGNNDVLSTAKQVASRLSQLCDKPFTRNPCQEDGIRLQTDEQMFKDCIKHLQRLKVVDASIPDSMQYNDDKIPCPHYIRKCSLVTPCCDKIYSCRVCHDAAEDHELNYRKLVKQVKCNQCGHVQGIVSSCSECQINFGFYFCEECRLYDDTDKGQYHCDLCGTCRVGGKDNFFHCTKCDICIAVSQKPTHFCMKKASRMNCMICFGSIHSSRKPCEILKCGHFIHGSCFQKCLKDLIKNCPLCNQPIP